MKPRDTSIAVYLRIKSEGLLSKLRQIVYDILFEFGPLTAEEVRVRTHGVKQVSVSPRMSELVERKVVAEVGRKICSVTGNEAILWDVTSNLPEKPEPKITQNQKLKARVKELEEELEQLKFRMTHLYL